MVTKEFVKDFLMMPLATAKALEEIIPEETDIEKLKEIVKFAGHLATGWKKVWELAIWRLAEDRAARGQDGFRRRESGF